MHTSLTEQNTIIKSLLKTEAGLATEENREISFKNVFLAFAEENELPDDFWIILLQLSLEFILDKKFLSAFLLPTDSCTD